MTGGTVCLDCHRILSTWQLSAGTELQQDAARGDLDSTRALLVGAAHLIQLYAQRHPEVTWVPAPLAIHTARAVSKLLDACGAPDRPGRWLPDPTVPPTEATPVPWPGTVELARVTEIADLVRALAGILGEVAPWITETLAGVAADPAAWKAAFDRAVEETEAAGELAALVDDYVERSGRVIGRLLALEDLSGIDAQLVGEVALCADAGRGLMEWAFTLPFADTEVAS